MRVPIETSKLLDLGGDLTVRDLLSSLVFNPVDGTIRLNGDRIVMQRATVNAELRRELIRLLGHLEARIFLMRLGFLTGQADARFVRTRWPNLNVGDAFTAGARLHTFSGVVRTEAVYNDFDFLKGRFAAEFLWHNSVEAIDLRNARQATEPVCWTQLGYASGYATEFFNTLVVYKEVECAAQGHDHCRVIGRTASGWGAGDPDVKLFVERIAAFDGRVFPLPASRPHMRVATGALSDLDRAVLTPVQEDLDRLVGVSLPILVSGETGTGRSRAAHYLQQAANAPGAEVRSLSGASINLEICDEISGRRKNHRRAAKSKALIINAIETIPAEIQPHLARAIEEGMLADGPRIIAVAAAEPASSAFSSGLWSILSGLEIRLPTLAQRSAEQRVSLAECLLSLHATKMNLEKPRLDAGALKLIQQSRWPGNLPQMRWVLLSVLNDGRGAAVTEQQIEARLKQWPFAAPIAGEDSGSINQIVNTAMSAREFSLPLLERALYQAAKERTGGNLSAAARLLGLTRPQLAYRLKESPSGNNATGNV